MDRQNRIDFHSLLLVVFSAVVSFGFSAAADIVHESATMGSYPQYSGYIVDSTWFIGSRFYISEETQITSVGGHITQDSAGNLFAAIVKLINSSDLPNGHPFYSSEVVASKVFVPAYPSRDYRTPLSVVLSRGWYALVFGSGQLGASGGEAWMPYTGQSDLPGASYFLWYDTDWYDSASDNMRFVVEGYPYLPGRITGSKFNDLDADGNWDGAEDGIQGWEIYLDLNDNGQYETSEPNVITGLDGFYEFTDLVPGPYVVAEMERAGWQQTFPFPDVGGAHTIVVDPNEVVENVNFGNYDTGAEVIYIQATEDTYANSTNPDTNYGSSDSLSSGYDGSAVYRTFLKFDLSNIPAGNIVTSATLRLHNNFISIPAPELDVYQISDRWEELTVTWNDQPSNIGGLIAINRSLVSGEETTWDVTDEMDDQYVGDGFYSVKIVSPTEGVQQMAGFWSKDLGWPPFAPTLEIEYMPIFGGGAGEPDDPYQIWTPEQFNTIGLYSNRRSKHYKLMADISLADYTGYSYNRVSISNDGLFDGNFHSISDFSYFATSSNLDSAIGLFATINEGTLKNLKLLSPNVYTNHYSQTSVGPLAGVADGADIWGCSVIGGSVDGESAVGGLVGYAKASYISGCSSSASVTGGSNIGGLVGNVSIFGGGGIIADCYARGDVSGDDYVGGFIGDSSDTGIVNCYSTGLVSGTSHTGGFSGYNVVGFPIGDNVIGCFWDVQSSGEPNSVVATGLTTAQMQDINTFIDAGWDFAGETANGGSDHWAMPGAGGYPVLWHELPVAPPLPPFAGGSGTAAYPYLIGTETQLNSIGHNQRLMDKHFRLINDLDMTGMKFNTIAGRPYEFSGTFDGDNHTVSDILIEPEIFIGGRIGFVVTVKGNNAVMRNLTLVDPNLVSVWGWGVGSLVGMNDGGTITNCHAVNANVVGMSAVGGLVGGNLWYGRISDCSVTGSIAASDVMAMIGASFGGLVGENTFWSDIERSYTNVTVLGGNGNGYVGGLVGNNVIYGQITNCYALGSVIVSSTEHSTGGLIGKEQGGTEMSHCYSGCTVTAPVGNDSIGGLVGRVGGSSEQYTACFWDSEINPGLTGIGNETDPCGVTGESTANMQTETTFTDAGWDFLGETANGTEDIWAVLEGIDYPEFVWQGPLAVSLDIDSTWMYQNVLTSTNSKLTATVSIADDPLENTGYTYEWEFILPDDVTIAPTITNGGILSDPCCTFAAPGCDQPEGLSDSGQPLTIRVTVTGDDHGNSAQAEAQFGIALLGDTNNDAVVNVADRAIINAFWRLGAAGPYTFTDCNVNSDTAVNVADRAIANAVWRGVLGQNSVSSPCPLR